MLCPLQPELREAGAHLLTRLLAGNAFEHERQGDIVHDPFMRQEQILLLHIADAPCLARDILIPKQDPAAVWYGKPGKDVEKRAFSHTADAQQAYELILMQRQAYILDDRRAIKAFCDVFCFQPVHSSASFPCAARFLSSDSRW